MRHMIAAPSDSDSPTPHRARYREQSVAEIKSLALEQLSDAGTGGLSLNAIARSMGMTGPAIYRYFSSRDELLTQLIVDGYDSLADTVQAAVAREPEDDPRARVRAFCITFREWALANVARYELLFGTPVPGYVAPDDRTTIAARRIMAVVIGEAARLPATRARTRRRGNLPSAVAPSPDQWSGADDVPVEVLYDAVTMWTRLHGFISLELRGHLGAIIESTEQMYLLEVEALLDDVSGPL
jgi:AcrR family transcriptional regulator